MFSDECVLYRDWAAKDAAAFLRISRSSVTRLSSALRGADLAGLFGALGAFVSISLHPVVERLGADAESSGDRGDTVTPLNDLRSGLPLELFSVSDPCTHGMLLASTFTDQSVYKAKGASMTRFR